MKKYNIDAVHPVLRRIIKFNLTKEQLTELLSDLENYGYEKTDMIIKEAEEVSKGEI